MVKLIIKNLCKGFSRQRVESGLNNLAEADRNAADASLETTRRGPNPFAGTWRNT